MGLNRDQLLEKLKLKIEPVMIGDDSVNVSQIGAADFIRMWNNPEYQTDDSIDMSKLLPALVAYSVVDDDGNRIFSAEDAAILSRSSREPFALLANAAKRLNGLMGDEIKNSEPSQTESSSSDSV